MPASRPHPPAAAVSGSYIPTLDGWRAIAVGLVISLHAADSIGDSWGPRAHGVLEAIFSTYGGGLLGVKIFFAISGFLITSRLLREEQADGAIGLKSFYFRRVFRILPASLTFTFTVGALALAGILHVPLICWLGAVFCFTNYLVGFHSWYLGHFWSLAVEEHFYLLWPSLLVVAGRGRRIGIAIALALAVGLWRTIAFKYRITYTDASEFWGRTDVQFDGLLWGSILALACATPRLAVLVRVATAPRYWWLYIGVLGACLVLSTGDNWKITYALLCLIPILLALIVVGTTLHPTSIVGRMLETQPFRWFGHISYSLYLWNQLFLTFSEARAPSLHLLQSWPVNLAAALSCATASYYFIERPFIRLGHKVTSGSAVAVPVAQQSS